MCLVMMLWNMTKALLVKRKWCDGGDGAEPTKLVTAVVTCTVSVMKQPATLSPRKLPCY